MPLSDNVYGKSIKEQGRTSAGGNSFSWDFLLKLYKTAIIEYSGPSCTACPAL